MLKSVLENKTDWIHSDFNIKTDNLIVARKPDIV